MCLYIYTFFSFKNVQNRVPFVPAIPSNLPRMFVPVAPVPSGIRYCVLI